MTIELFTGFPGSGKSYAATKDGLIVSESLLNKKHVIANFPIKPKKKFFHKFKIFHRFLKDPDDKYKPLRWTYKDNDELTVRYLVETAQENGWVGKEGSCLVIFDEASMPFNSRDWNKPDRKDWIKFLSQHRKFGYDFIMITQDGNMLDKQIRKLAEYEVIFRRLNSSFMFSWLSIFKITLFASIKYWNGMRFSRGTVKIYRYQKSVGDRYDTANLFQYEDELDLKTD